jgi:hypothetical protein
MAVLQVRGYVLSGGFRPRHFFANPGDAGAAQAREAAAIIGRQIPQDKFVLSDVSPLLRVFGNTSARLPRMIDFDGTPLDWMTWSDIKRAGDRGRLWGLVIWDEDACRKGLYGDALKDIIANPAGYPQLRKRELEGGMRVFEFVNGTEGGM